MPPVNEVLVPEVRLRVGGADVPMEAEADVVQSREGGQWSIDAETLAAQPEALSRAILHRAMVRASRGLPVSFEHVERALDLALGNGTGFDGPGQRVERIGRTVVLRREPADSRGGRSRRPAKACSPRSSIPRMAPSICWANVRRKAGNSSRRNSRPAFPSCRTRTPPRCTARRPPGKKSSRFRMR